jgi:two-component sensor histidine kinase
MSGGSASKAAFARAPDPFRAAFERAAIGLAILDADGATIREANAYVCELLGYGPGELTGRSVAEIGEIVIPVPAGIRTWRRADGVPLHVRVRRAEEADRDGEPVLVVEVVDADEMVRAEQNRDALTAAGLGEWRWDAATGLVTLSRRAAHILGYPPGHAVAWSSLSARIDPDEVERIRALVRDSGGAGPPYAFECRVSRDDDDREVWIGARGQAAIAPDGSLEGMVGVIQDITTRVEVRTALRDREQRLRIATAVADLGIFEWHMLDDQAIWENERMFEIFGRTPADGPIGKGVFLDQVLHPEDRVPFRKAISTALRGDTVLHARGRIRRHSDSAWRTIDLAGRFEREEPHHRLPRRLIGVVADVTDRLVAEERQTLLIRELHHRVKNTLATVQAIVGSTARTASSIETFYEAFVGRIMSLAHTHSVLTEDTWQTASLRNLLTNELKPYAEGAMDGPAGRISLDGPDVDLPSEIAVPIGMAIHELTTNAAKYGALSTESGRVSITWEILPGGPAGRLRFFWRETGGPEVRPPSRHGFGSRLLQRVLSTQVRAEVETEYLPEGLRLTMTAPLPPRNDALNPLA